MEKIVVLRVLFVGLITLFSPNVFADSWNGSTRLENFNATGVKVSVIQFTKDNQTVTYKPTNPPYGSVLLEKAVFKSRSPFFITGWAHGAKSIMFRIFDPEHNGNNSLCEFESDAESARLQILNNELQIEITKEHLNPPTQWLPCAQLSDVERKLDGKK